MFLDELDADTLREILRTSDAPRVLSSPDGKILWANAAAEAFFGRTSRELTQLTWEQLTFSAADLGVELANVQELLDGTRTRYRMTKRYTHPAKHPLPCDIGVVRIPEDTTQPIRFCNVTIFPHKNDYFALQKDIQQLTETQNETLRALGNVLTAVGLEENSTYYPTYAPPQRTQPISPLVYVLIALILGCAILGTVAIVVKLRTATAIQETPPINTPV